MNNFKTDSTNKRVSDFLQKYNINCENIDMQKYVDLFLVEMKKGLEGQGSSLRMFPSFITPSEEIPLNKPVIVIDAGGTNLRTAIVIFEKGNVPVIKEYRQHIMPGSKEEVSREDFFKVITNNIKDFLDKSENIGFVFSYQMKMYPDIDGRLFRFTKEIKAKEIEGELIGKNLLLAIKKLGLNYDKKVVLLNDTVASLLAGVLVSANRKFESYIGLIFGTGLNACYLEKNKNIKIDMVKNLNQEDYQVINIEAGSFSKGPNGEIDFSFNSKTINPEIGRYEKMASGAYLGRLSAEVLRFGAKDGIFSGRFSKKINSSFSLETEDINDFLHYPPGSGSKINKLAEHMNNKDLVSLYYIFDGLVERSALLAAIVLSAAIIKSGKGKNPLSPVCINAEGSTFYNLKNFKFRVKLYLKKILEQRGNYFYEINRVDNAVLLGGAVAGLSCL
ncbi:MAG: hexokinase [Actinobacteria bacterium]|nr:hexokinase [Actinomycetota bacterium]